MLWPDDNFDCCCHSVPAGKEIARHIAGEADHVYQSARTFTGPGTARERASVAAPAPAATAVGGDTASVTNSNTCQLSTTERSNSNMLQDAVDPTAATSEAGCRAEGSMLPAGLNQQQQEIPTASEPTPNITRVPMLQQLQLQLGR